LGELGSSPDWGAALAEKLVEPPLNDPSDAFELFKKGHLVEESERAAVCRKSMGKPYPNTTLLDAATGRYNPSLWPFK
jgi:hypothetical protein